MSENRANARDITTRRAQLIRVLKLLSAVLHAQFEMRLHQISQFLLQRSLIHGEQFFCVHCRLSLHADLADNERGFDRQLGGSESESFASQLFVNPVHFVKHTTRLH